MKRINLIKYGFIRTPEQDFTDDGSKFQTFSVGRVRVSKCIDAGQAYLSVQIDGTLPYDVYSKLPSYNKATWYYNGIGIESLTEVDLMTFYEACVNYEQEYRLAESTIKYPTIAELTKQCKLIQEKVIRELDEIEQLMSEQSVNAAVELSDYEWRSLKQALIQLVNRVSQFDPKVLPQKMFMKSSSFTFVKEDNNDLVNPTYWYVEIKKMFYNHGLI